MKACHQTRTFGKLVTNDVLRRHRNPNVEVSVRDLRDHFSSETLPIVSKRRRGGSLGRKQEKPNTLTHVIEIYWLHFKHDDHRRRSF